MSYAQHLGGLGAVVPRVMREMFADVLQVKGEVIKLYHKAQVVDCPCWDPIYKNADQDCEACKGTGKISGFAEVPDRVFLGCIFIDAEGRQDQHQKFRTRAGTIETFDGQLFCEGRWYDDIKIGDVIVYKPRGRTTGMEMRIISKSPRSANDGEIIFIECNLERQPSSEVQGASVQETV